MAAMVETKPLLIVTDKEIMVLLRPPASFKERVERHRQMLAEQYPLASPKVVDMSSKNLARLDERISRLENEGGHATDEDRKLWCAYTAAAEESHYANMEGQMQRMLRIV
ncbi:MAG: hypothetical protein KGH69_03855 [Candidatus Micrarchaeota archaeon]|nr:hypothetical protein [Candidatus Micrarchaeota archaeon]